MTRADALRRTLRAAAAALLGASLLAVAPSAAAGPAAPSGAGAPVALNDNGPIFASASGSLITLGVHALSPAILPQTDVDLAHSEAQADSDADLDAAQDGGQRSAALAGTTGDSDLLGSPLDLQTTTASAPESESNEDVLIALPPEAAQLLELEVIRTTAAANWVNDVECVAGDTPLSLADQALADLALLQPAEGQSVVELDTDDDDGAVDTEASTWLAPIDGPGVDPRAVQARTTTTITSANILNGFDGPGSAIQVDAVQSPDYVVSASGLPGGASVTGPQPVVNVTIAGEPLITLDQRDETAEATITDLVLGDLIDIDGELVADLIADLGLPAELLLLLDPLEDEIQNLIGSLQPVVRLSMPYDESIDPAGTFAEASGSLLRVEVLAPDAVPEFDPESPLAPLFDALATAVPTIKAEVLDPILDAIGADLGAPLVQLDLAPFAARVEAPAGGIDCGGPTDDNPLRELNKHVSATEVPPGGTFEYNISVPNRGPCALTDVVVTDTVTGPGRISDTEPDATVSEDGKTATWDIGDLAVNETVNLTITVAVDQDAPDGATFDDAVTATGNCDGREVEQTDEVLDIPRVVDDFTGPCNVQFSNKDASHQNVFPGETFSYYVHAYNSGAEACTDVVITDTLDDRVSFVSCNKGCANEGQTVTWTLDTLAPGSSAILSVVVQVDDDATGTLANTAIVDPANGDPKTVSTTGPVVGDTSVIKDPLPASRVIAGPLPRTGLAGPAALGAVLAAGALGLLALRRRALA